LSWVSFALPQPEQGKDTGHRQSGCH